MHDSEHFLLNKSQIECLFLWLSLFISMPHMSKSVLFGSSYEKYFYILDSAILPNFSIKIRLIFYISCKKIKKTCLYDHNMLDLRRKRLLSKSTLFDSSRFQQKTRNQISSYPVPDPIQS